MENIRWEENFDFNGSVITYEAAKGPVCPLRNSVCLFSSFFAPDFLLFYSLVFSNKGFAFVRVKLFALKTHNYCIPPKLPHSLTKVQSPIHDVKINK